MCFGVHEHTFNVRLHMYVCFITTVDAVAAVIVVVTHNTYY